MSGEWCGLMAQLMYSFPLQLEEEKERAEASRGYPVVEQNSHENNFTKNQEQGLKMKQTGGKEGEELIHHTTYCLDPSLRPRSLFLSLRIYLSKSSTPLPSEIFLHYKPFRLYVFDSSIIW